MSSRAAIATLSEFFLHAHTQHMVFDLGRGTRNISNQTFFEWEQQQAPCANPRQNHAWFCIVFWNEKLSEQRFIWFIKLPLDENGLIISAALQQFLDIIAQALGKQLQHSANSQAQLPQNPYVFTPSQQQLALCNALIRKSLNIYNELGQHVVNYMQVPNLVVDDTAWAKLSVQEVADFVIHPGYVADENVLTNASSTKSSAGSNSNIDSQAIIAKNLQHYAPAVQTCILASLEAIEVNENLSNELIAFHKTCCSKQNSNMAALCLRAMSFAPHKLCINHIRNMINTQSVSPTSAGQSETSNQTKTTNIEQTTNNASALDLDTCVVIAGRYWQLLKDETLLSLFMRHVAVSDNSHQLFKGLYADLVKVPAIRDELLRFIRHPERSQAVSIAIGALFASTSTPKSVK